MSKQKEGGSLPTPRPARKFPTPHHQLSVDDDVDLEVFTVSSDEEDQEAKNQEATTEVSEQLLIIICKIIISIHPNSRGCHRIILYWTPVRFKNRNYDENYLN